MSKQLSALGTGVCLTGFRLVTITYCFLWFPFLTLILKLLLTTPQAIRNRDLFFSRQHRCGRRPPWWVSPLSFLLNCIVRAIFPLTNPELGLEQLGTNPWNGIEQKVGSWHYTDYEWLCYESMSIPLLCYLAAYVLNLSRPKPKVH